MQKLLLLRDNRITFNGHCGYDSIDDDIGCHGCFPSRELVMCEHWLEATQACQQFS